jgi:hypothetical protein
MLPDYFVTHVPGLYRATANVRCSFYEAGFVKRKVNGVRH